MDLAAQEICMTLFQNFLECSDPFLVSSRLISLREKSICSQVNEYCSDNLIPVPSENRELRQMLRAPLHSSREHRAIAVLHPQSKIECARCSRAAALPDAQDCP